MIPVAKAPEPENFDTKVAIPGNNALLELTGDPSAPPRRGRPRKRTDYQAIGDIPAKELPTYWPDLRRAYNNICAYLSMKIHKATGLATADHFKPKSKYPKQAYSWDNLRLSSHQMNTNKDDFEDVLDPFEIQEGWFVIDIASFEVEPNANLDQATKKQIKDTIARLKLNEPTYCAAREEMHDLYHGLSPEVDEPLPFTWLQRESPFVASELIRQKRLREEDLEAEWTNK